MKRMLLVALASVLIAADKPPVTASQMLFSPSPFLFGIVTADKTAAPQPQVLWVQVDRTPPTVRIQRVDIARDHQTGDRIIRVRWIAEGRNLQARPVTLSYSADGTWTTVATQLDCLGEYSLKASENINAVRVEVKAVVGPGDCQDERRVLPESWDERLRSSMPSKADLRAILGDPRP